MFWDIIETARASAGLDRPFHESLTDHLATLTEQDILKYHERFEKMHDALYRHDLWAAAYLIRAGCSDDSFIDFRAGLIAQGRDWYEQATTSPAIPPWPGPDTRSPTTRCSTRRSTTQRPMHSSGPEAMRTRSGTR